MSNDPAPSLVSTTTCLGAGEFDPALIFKISAGFSRNAGSRCIIKIKEREIRAITYSHLCS